MHIVRKPRHLTKTHKFENDSEEYRRHLLSGFRQALRRKTEMFQGEEVDRRSRPVVASREDRTLAEHEVAFLASDNDQENYSRSGSTGIPPRPVFEEAGDRALHNGGRCKLREVFAPHSLWSVNVSRG